MLCRTWWNRATSPLANVSFMTADEAGSAYATRIESVDGLMQCSAAFTVVVEHAHTVAIQGAAGGMTHGGRCVAGAQL